MSAFHEVEEAMLVHEIARLLYAAVTHQPRPPWKRLRRRERFERAAQAIVDSSDSRIIGLPERLQDTARELRREQLWRMRHGKF